MTGELTHLDQAGAAHMVDVGGKVDTAREAVATGRITMSAAAAQAIVTGAAAKGDVLAVAAPHLRIIAKHGAGVDSVDLEAATRAGVVVAVASVDSGEDEAV